MAQILIWQGYLIEPDIESPISLRQAKRDEQTWGLHTAKRNKLY